MQWFPVPDPDMKLPYSADISDKFSGEVNVQLGEHFTGQTEISMSIAASSKNELDFIDGVTDENLWFEQSGNDLKIDVLGTNTSVTVDNWFSGSSGALQEPVRIFVGEAVNKRVIRALA